jgi:hypothetical protein
MNGSEDVAESVAYKASKASGGSYCKTGQPPQLSIIFRKNPGRLNHAIETKSRNPFGIADISLSSWHVLNLIDLPR